MWTCILLGSNPYGLAVDPISKLLFYTDLARKVIGVFSLDTSDSIEVVSGHIDIPNSVVTDHDG